MSDEERLLAAGWQRCFIADEPRLSEAVELYRELGLEVRLLPVPLDDAGCTECMRADPARYRVIYTRRAPAAGAPPAGQHEHGGG